MKYDYEGIFLEQWEPRRRSLIVNQFCNAVRRGARDVDAVIIRVALDAERRALPYGNEEREKSQRLLLKVIHDAETQKFAEFILWRESLAYEEKQRLKQETGLPYQQQYMAKQPPTIKQLAYLEALACHVIPTNKLEASQLIERYKGGSIGDV